MKPERSDSPAPEPIPAEDFVLFAVQFAQRDLSRLREGDWLNLREDFETYLGRRGVVSIAGETGPAWCASPITPPLPEHYTKQDFEALQARVFTRLQVWICQGKDGAALDLQELPVTRAAWPHGHRHDTPRRHQIVIHGATDAVFLAILEEAVTHEPADRILACPECQTIFY